MEKTSIVPNQFFDLLARVVPGGVLIYVLERLSGPNLLSGTLEVFVPNELKKDVVPWLVVLVALSYALGHGLSPLVKLIDVLGKAARSTAWYQAKYPRRAALYQDETKRYNHLRFKHPNRLIYATRIRAEYTMYGGMAAAILVPELYCLVRWWSGAVVPAFAWHLIAVLVILAMMFRYFDVHRRFCETIRSFEEVEQSAHVTREALEVP
jgi:hypothetical protein